LLISETVLQWTPQEERIAIATIHTLRAFALQAVSYLKENNFKDPDIRIVYSSGAQPSPQGDRLIEIRALFCGSGDQMSIDIIDLAAKACVDEANRFLGAFDAPYKLPDHPVVSSEGSSNPA
jgi:hypothetical protein